MADKFLGTIGLAALWAEIVKRDENISEDVNNLSDLLEQYKQELKESLDAKQDSAEAQKAHDDLAKDISDLRNAMGQTDLLTLKVADSLEFTEDGFVYHYKDETFPVEKNVIYLVSNHSESTNKFDEYLLVNGQMELIGSTEIDLSGLWTEEAGIKYVEDHLPEIATDEEVSEWLETLTF